MLSYSLVSHLAPLGAGSACAVGGSKPTLTARLRRALNNTWLPPPPRLCLPGRPIAWGLLTRQCCWYYLKLVCVCVGGGGGQGAYQWKTAPPNDPVPEILVRLLIVGNRGGSSTSYQHALAQDGRGRSIGRRSSCSLITKDCWEHHQFSQQ